jgi:hypothetical protein
MAINIDSTEKTKVGEILTARVNDMRIEVELEAITPNATRMRSVAKQQGSILLDQATGLEIVLQTEKVLNAFATPAERSGNSIPLHPSRRLQPTADAED